MGRDSGNLYSAGMARPGDPDDPFAALRERLARLFPGRVARVDAEPDPAYQAAVKRAVLEAIPVEPATPGKAVAPATPREPAKPPEPAAGATRAADVSSSTSEPIVIVPAPLGRPRRPPQPASDEGAADRAPAIVAAPAPTSPRAPVIQDVVVAEPEPGPSEGLEAGTEAEADAELAAAPAIETPAQELSAAPEPALEAIHPPAESEPAFPSTSAAQGVEPPPDLPISPRWRKLGATAPEDLLQAPPSAGATVDDFFDGLVRRVEGDR